MFKLRKKRKRKKGSTNFQPLLIIKWNYVFLCSCFLKIVLYIENDFCLHSLSELPHNYLDISRNLWDEVYWIGKVQWWLEKLLQSSSVYVELLLGSLKVKWQQGKAVACYFATCLLLWLMVRTLRENAKIWGWKKGPFSIQKADFSSIK